MLAITLLIHRNYSISYMFGCEREGIGMDYNLNDNGPYRTIKQWNSLPATLTTAPSLNVFKSGVCELKH